MLLHFLGVPGTAALGGLGTGAIGGGLLGRYNSDKKNTTPATVLGALGGVAGSAVGAVPGLASYMIQEGLVQNSAQKKIDTLAKAKADLDEATKGLVPVSHSAKRQLQLDVARANRALKKTPAVLKFLARHPRLRAATGLGLITTPMLAGGTLGATLGGKGGDALA